MVMTAETTAAGLRAEADAAKADAARPLTAAKAAMDAAKAAHDASSLEADAVFSMGEIHDSPGVSVGRNILKTANFTLKINRLEMAERGSAINSVTSNNNQSHIALIKMSFPPS